MKMLVVIAAFLAVEIMLLAAFANTVFAGSRKKTWRLLGIAALGLLCVFWLAGCSWLGRDHVVVKPEPVEVPKYLREPLPAKLVQPCVYAEPDPACWRDGHREFCNRQLLDMRAAYADALAQCNDDKTALRALGPTGQ